MINGYYIFNDIVFYIKKIIDDKHLMCDIIYMINDISISHDVIVTYDIIINTLYINGNKMASLSLDDYNKLVIQKNKENAQKILDKLNINKIVLKDDMTTVSLSDYKLETINFLKSIINKKD